MDEKAQLEEFAKFLRVNGIRMVAWDFDQTIIRVHSQGAVLPDRIDELAAQVSADFVRVQRLIRSSFPEMKQAVVSFTDARMTETKPGHVAGDALILAVLEKIFGFHSLGPARFRVVTHFPKLDADTLWPNNKQHHLRLVRDDQFQPAQVLLIDDDPNNRKAAEAEGYNTLAFDASKNLGFYVDMIHLPGKS